MKESIEDAAAMWMNILVWIMEILQLLLRQIHLQSPQRLMSPVNAESYAVLTMDAKDMLYETTHISKHMIMSNVNLLQPPSVQT